MGRTVYWMNVSVDLLIEGRPGEDGGGGWVRIGEQLHREFNRRASDLALMVNGRVVKTQLPTETARPLVSSFAPATIARLRRR
jgi:hypothetical protein